MTGWTGGQQQTWCERHPEVCLLLPYNLPLDASYVDHTMCAMAACLPYRETRLGTHSYLHVTLNPM